MTWVRAGVAAAVLVMAVFPPLSRPARGKGLLEALEEGIVDLLERDETGEARPTGPREDRLTLVRSLLRGDGDTPRDPFMEKAEPFIRSLEIPPSGGAIVALRDPGEGTRLRRIHEDPSCGEVSLRAFLTATAVIELDGDPRTREILILVREEQDSPPVEKRAECLAPEGENHALYIIDGPSLSGSETDPYRFRVPDRLAGPAGDTLAPVLVTDLNRDGKQEVWVSSFRVGDRNWRKYTLTGLEEGESGPAPKTRFNSIGPAKESILKVEEDALVFTVGYRYWVSKRFVEAGRVEIRGAREGLEPTLTNFK